MSLTTKLMLLLLLLVSLELRASEGIEDLHRIFDEVAEEQRVPANLLRAICWAESKHDPEAYNHSDGGALNSSFGICQVLYTTAKRLGLKDSRCEIDFSGVRYTKNYKHCKLFGLHTNITFAAKELRYQLIRYNKSWISAIAAYNTGSVRICKSGKVTRQKDRKVIYTCKKGGFLNQVYIDQVIKALNEGR